MNEKSPIYGYRHEHRRNGSAVIAVSNPSTPVHTPDELGAWEALRRWQDPYVLKSREAEVDARFAYEKSKLALIRAETALADATEELRQDEAEAARIRENIDRALAEARLLDIDVKVG